MMYGSMNVRFLRDSLRIHGQHLESVGLENSIDIKCANMLMIYRLTEFHVSSFTVSPAVTNRPTVKEYFCFASILLCRVLEINYCERSWKTFRESNAIHRFRTPSSDNSNSAFWNP